MSEEYDITGDLDLLGDWLDAKGYTEEAGLCTRAMDFIHKQRAENEKLRAALSELVGAASRVNMRTGTEFYTAWRAAYDITKAATIEQSSIVQSPAAAALKETGE